MIVAVVLHWGRLGFEWLRESDGSEQRQVLKRVLRQLPGRPLFPLLVPFKECGDECGRIGLGQGR